MNDSHISQSAPTPASAREAGLLAALQQVTTLIANDGYAMSFQSMGQYRTALLKAMNTPAAADAAALPEVLTLPMAIMNLPCNPPDGWGGIQQTGYKIGHRDARHAAAELVTTQEVAASSTDAQAAAEVRDAAPMTTDEAREYLIKYMEQNFTDKTFHRYIRNDQGNRQGLAGDFAWQLARALRAGDTGEQADGGAHA